MERVTLPHTELRVSRICLGCWQMNDSKANISWEAQPYETSKAIVDKCLELGINFFDTAEGYAGSEEVLGKCLQGRRDQAVIASKFGRKKGSDPPPYSALEIEQTVDRCLRKLQTDYLDLLQVHFPTYLEKTEEAIEALNREVAKGRIRSWGVCNFGPKNLQKLIEMKEIPAVNQIGYNLLWRSPEREVIPTCMKENITVLAYSPLQQGLLSGNYMKLDDVPMGRRRGKHFAPESCPKSRHRTVGCEKELFESLQGIKEACKTAGVPMAKAALSWVLQQESKPVVIVGCRTPEQVGDNYNIVKISEELKSKLTELSEPVKEKIGKHLDQWANPDRCE